MKNKTIGSITLISYGISFVSIMAGTYTEELTAWDQIGTLFAVIGFGFAIWCAIRLYKLPEVKE